MVTTTISTTSIPTFNPGEAIYMVYPKRVVNGKFNGSSFIEDYITVATAHSSEVPACK
jgi:hypothetical protein